MSDTSDEIEFLAQLFYKSYLDVPYLERKDMSNAPVTKINVGNVQLSVWENEVGKGKDKFTTTSISLNKSYKKDDEWKTSTSFKYSELPFVIMACQRALENKYMKDEVDELEL